MTDSEQTGIVFRMWSEAYDVIALIMPIVDGICGSYSHIGQHGSADYGFLIDETRPASPEEYAELKAELEQIGYNIKVLKRRPRNV